MKGTVRPPMGARRAIRFAHDQAPLWPLATPFIGQEQLCIDLTAKQANKQAGKQASESTKALRCIRHFFAECAFPLSKKRKNNQWGKSKNGMAKEEGDPDSDPERCAYHARIYGSAAPLCHVICDLLFITFHLRNSISGNYVACKSYHPFRSQPKLRN